jgi:hypothetical protein
MCLVAYIVLFQSSVCVTGSQLHFIRLELFNKKCGSAPKGACVACCGTSLDDTVVDGSSLQQGIFSIGNGTRRTNRKPACHGQK